MYKRHCEPFVNDQDVEGFVWILVDGICQFGPEVHFELTVKAAVSHILVSSYKSIEGHYENHSRASSGFPRSYRPELKTPSRQEAERIDVYDIFTKQSFKSQLIFVPAEGVLSSLVRQWNVRRNYRKRHKLTTRQRSAV